MLLHPLHEALAQRHSLRQTEHRPWPLPPGHWRIGQSWVELLFAHWPVPVQAMRHLIPRELELDTFEGRSWVGAVPFRMRTVRFVLCPPVAGTSAFPELNVRTYVVHDGRPGVFFLSLDAGNALAVALGRRLYGLPYLRARVSLNRRSEEISFDSRRLEPGWPPASFSGRYRPTAPAAGASAPGMLEHWLTERYCFYTVREGRLWRTEVHHAPWRLQPAVAELRHEALLEPFGLEVAGAPLLHYSEQQHVVAWPAVDAGAVSAQP